MSNTEQRFSNNEKKMKVLQAVEYLENSKNHPITVSKIDMWVIGRSPEMMMSSASIGNFCTTLIRDGYLKLNLDYQEFKRAFLLTEKAKNTFFGKAALSKNNLY